MPYLIEPYELLSKLDDEDLIIIDLSSKDNYVLGHIQGAIWLDYKKTQPPAISLPGFLPPTNQLRQLFSELGHTSNKTYVVYDDEGGGWAGRFCWLLDSISHHKYLYLNGGRVAWKKADLLLVTDVPIVTPTSTIQITSNYAPTVYSSYVKDNLSNPHVVFWDARSFDEYNGTKIVAKKGGRIPGAVHLEWTSCMDSSTKKLLPNLMEILESKGITPDKQIITYCQSHHRSGFTYLVAKILGFKQVKAYAGGWSDWSNL